MLSGCQSVILGQEGRKGAVWAGLPGVGGKKRRVILGKVEPGCGPGLSGSLWGLLLRAVHSWEPRESSPHRRERPTERDV